MSVIKSLGRMVAAVACLAAGSQAWAQSRDTPASVAVVRISSSIQEGQVWAEIRHPGLFTSCNYTTQRLTWGSKAGKLNVKAFEQPLREELKKENFTVVGDPNDPFTQKEKGNIEISVVISSIKSTFCEYINNRTKGSANLETDWEVYFTRDRQVVMKLHTAGASEVTEFAYGGVQTILISAMNESLRKLTGSEDFKHLITAASSPPADKKGKAPSFKTKLPLPGSLAAKPAKISDAVGAAHPGGVAVLGLQDGRLPHVGEDMRPHRVRRPLIQLRHIGHAAGQDDHRGVEDVGDHRQGPTEPLDIAV